MTVWQEYLSTHAIGFLLPAAELNGVSVEAATVLLERLTKSPRALRLLRLAAVFSSSLHDLASFVDAVESLARVLPSRSTIRTRHWQGGFHGRLDVRATQLLHAQAQRTSFVTREPVRSFDFPETLFLRAVLHRLVGSIRELREHEAISEKHSWGQVALSSASRLEHLVESSRLRHVPLLPLKEVTSHRVAAMNARHPAYRLAAEWHQRMVEGLDSSDPLELARVLAQGALWPASIDTRFEIAVAVRLVDALNQRLAERCSPSTFEFSRSIVMRDRSDIAAFKVGTRRLSVFYNQAELPSGACDAGTARYVGVAGRMRPDVTIRVHDGSAEVTAFVVEVKLTPDQSYVAQGFKEAVLYRWEYSDHLRSWPKAVVVTSCPLPSAELRPQDEVVALDWTNWPSTSLVDAFLDPLLRAASAKG